eukprot:gnl/TRDRNA2_/TRDRNA2_173870_c3_seq1.p1 gnl/TRDRNA2_/TRDRNA2_173870_c3~~gnl/TRDRNA2_/TRDRNA2_173870_c3_seq1.p1  ORF type:complete len:104 (-),score=8.85 gnl/TRDRNA2_/TRDRNA2_173870_c3_seq1:99-410(-)
MRGWTTKQARQDARDKFNAIFVYAMMALGLLMLVGIGLYTGYYPGFEGEEWLRVFARLACVFFVSVICCSCMMYLFARGSFGNRDLVMEEDTDLEDEETALSS